MITDKNKNKETVKNEPKKMPEVDRSRKVDSERSKEKQDSNKSGHKFSKDETYESKRTEVPKSETYER